VPQFGVTPLEPDGAVWTEDAQVRRFCQPTHAAGSALSPEYEPSVSPNLGHTLPPHFSAFFSLCVAFSRGVLAASGDTQPAGQAHHQRVLLRYDTHTHEAPRNRAYISPLTRACNATQHDTDLGFVKTFITTFQSFTTPEQLWEKLMQRCDSPRPPGPGQGLAKPAHRFLC
jgi:hypothetical protein